MLLVLLPCLYCLYFEVNDYRIWREMEEKLESRHLQTLTIPVKDFHWHDKNREIVVAGKMFDVKSIQRQGDQYIVTGLFDEAETELHIALEKLHRRNESGRDASLISTLLSQTLAQPVTATNLHPHFKSVFHSHTVIPDEQLYNTILSIHTPPPRV
jgi:hypothetical protein